MKTITCDKCGTRKNVKEAFLTVWNGHVIDLCSRCARPICKLIDGRMKTWPRT